jgi:thymidylate kinase
MGGGLMRYLLRNVLGRLEAMLLWRRRGVLMFLMGVDGSGKTTLARVVSDQHEAGGVYCYYRYLGLKNTLVQRVRRLLKPNDSHQHDRGQQGVVGSLAESSSFLANLFNLAVSFVYIVEYWLRCVRLMKPLRRHNDVVIVDRTYLDKLADLDRWGNRLFFHLLPHPDIVVALHGRAEVLYDRKREFAVPVLIEMQKKLEIALSFLERRGVRLVRIDTTLKNVDEAATIVQQSLWRLLRSRRTE